ncbi:MAG: N,N'-diacetyllegionaminate synthase [Enterobacterales bacterium]|jgi:N,N'-diacetyllegionaminate synthase
MIVLNDKKIGKGEKAFLVAEVAQAHDGSLGAAHSFIDAVSKSGVDAVKFQTHIASEESTLDEKFRVQFSKQDLTRYDYWKRMEFTESQWRGLAQHAKDVGLEFISTPFSIKAFEILDDLDMPFWKVPSGEIKSSSLLDRMIATKKPIVMSTGMSSRKEINDNVKILKESGNAFVILQCTSKYPTPYAQVGLNVLKELHEEHGCLVGLSDHSGTIYPALAAMTNGASFIEVHVALHKHQFGPDTSSSISLDELSILSEASKAFHDMNDSPVDKDKMAEELSLYRDLFFKSIALKKDLQSGVVLRKEMLTMKKPGTGISESELEKIIGKTLIRDVSANRLLTDEDFKE